MVVRRIIAKSKNVFMKISQIIRKICRKIDQTKEFSKFSRGNF